MKVYHQDNFTNYREYFVELVEKIYGNCVAFLDQIEEENYGLEYDVFYLGDDECYIINRLTGEYVNWYKFTHLGRDIHTNFHPRKLKKFLTNFKNSDSEED